MKFDKLIITGLPKSFNLCDSVEYLDPIAIGLGPEHIKYDAYPVECNDERGEDAFIIFKYNESSTGVYVLLNTITRSLTIELPVWAADADVFLYSAYVNAILSKHKRAHLFDKFSPLPYITEVDTQKMIDDRRKFLKRQLTTKDGFCMEGLNASFTLIVEHLRPAASIDVQIKELQNHFVDMQWRLGKDT